MGRHYHISVMLCLLLYIYIYSVIYEACMIRSSDMASTALKFCELINLCFQVAFTSFKSPLCRNLLLIMMLLKFGKYQSFILVFLLIKYNVFVALAFHNQLKIECIIIENVLQNKLLSLFKYKCFIKI